MQENSFISNFKTVIKLVVFLVIVIFAFNKAGAKYKEAADKNVVNAFTQQRYSEFYNQEPNSIDMVYIGSSHSYCTFDPEIIDSILKTSSWQMGTPLQHYDTSYYVLREVLNHQKPKKVVLEIYWDILKDEFEMKQANSFFEVLKNQELKDEYINKVFPINERIKYSLFPIRYQQDYFAYEANEIQNDLEEKYGVHKKALPEVEGTEYYRSRGYTYCDIIMPENEYDETNQFKGFDGEDWEFNRTQKKYIEKIIELCKNEGIELYFVTAPVANVSMEYIENYDIVHNTVAEFAKENNIPYIDYNIVNKEENLLTNENFRDDAHLNHSGVQIVDKHFAQWLMNN
ncbi:hypothetical protein B5E58_06435 [Tyzzerella sp. An114]|uniref:hypothetical protein n=1 Tax=Tyzzerella sp. An114 TaxID=1965545 RepID=UPI000B438A1B|nr:hypothetical protein [Tyzzerella sp. An114]OUQ58813.1 hypothetical protein B5E58_06435 [Tyzzerella sp. An114]HIT73360.1 hypothetical protein [Candidatus Fimicola cottocaccae]